MVRDSSRRIIKYSAKIQPDVIKQRFKDEKDSMVDQVTQQFSTLAQLEANAKAILDENEVATYLIPFYLSFVRQLYRITRTHTGTTANTEAQLYKSIWVARGLDDDVLIALASQLFGLTLTPESRGGG
jgi:hypothetical protein